MSDQSQMSGQLTCNKSNQTKYTKVLVLTFLVHKTLRRGLWFELDMCDDLKISSANNSHYKIEKLNSSKPLRSIDFVNLKIETHV